MTEKDNEMTITIPKVNLWMVLSIILAITLVISWTQNLTIKSTTGRFITPITTSTLTQSDQTSIGSKYQQILTQLSELNEKVENDDPSLVDAVQELTDKVHNLRALDPYYRFQEIKNSALPSGTPDYGEELGVSYDNAAYGVDVLAKLEQNIGFDNLNEEEKSRYIKIGTTQGTACEYCCGLKTSFATADGKRACGCAHNIAFSGLTMWMIQNDYTDEQILQEIQNWKALFFPKQTISKVIQEKVEAGEEGIEELLEEFPDFLPQMVGGC